MSLFFSPTNKRTTFSLPVIIVIILLFVFCFPSLSLLFLLNNNNQNFNKNKVNANILREDARLLPRLTIRDQFESTWYSAGYGGMYSCSCNKDYTYAVCVTQNGNVIKFQLSPFVLTSGPYESNYIRSCELYDTGNESSSLVFCVQGYSYFRIMVYNASDMTALLNYDIPEQSSFGAVPHLVVDTPKRVLYVSNYADPGYIFKFSNIDNVTAPTFEGNCSLNDGGSQLPAMMAKVDDLLFVYHPLSTGRLSSINLTTFTWNATIDFDSGIGYGELDNVVADSNYVYVLTSSNPSIVRCSHRSNKFRVVDVLQIGMSSSLYSLAISPDSSYLLFPASSAGIIIVNTSTFKLETRSFFQAVQQAASSRNAKQLQGIGKHGHKKKRERVQSKRLADPQVSGGPAPAVNSGDGRPIILPDGRVYAPRSDGVVRFFQYTHQRVDEIYPKLRPINDATITGSTLQLSSNAKAPLNCKANAGETFAICTLNTGGIVKYNLHPVSFSLSVKTLDKPVCDIFDNAASSLVVCSRSSTFTGLDVLNSADLSSLTNWSTSTTSFGDYAWVLVDSPTATAYVSTNSYAPNAIIYKIAGIDSNTPYFAGNVTFWDADYPAMLLKVGEFLYCYHYTSPVRLTRINLTDFTLWGSAVVLDSGENNEGYEKMVNDDGFIYVVMSSGNLQSVVISDGSFYWSEGYLSLGYSSTKSVAITKDLKYILVTDFGTSSLLIVDVKSFSLLDDNGFVPDAFGRPLTLRSTSTIYAFSSNVDSWYAFIPAFKTPTAAMTESLTESKTESETTSKIILSHSHSQIDSRSHTVAKIQTASKTQTKIPPTTTSTTSTTTTSSSTTTPTTTTTSSTTSVPSTTTTTTTTTTKINTSTTTSTTSTTARPTTTIAVTAATSTTTRNATIRQRTATYVPSLAVTPVAAPEEVAAPTSVGSTFAGVISADLASPTMTMMALSIAAVGRACSNGVNYVDTPPRDERLHFPQGSLIPAVQILLSTDVAEDYWRRHFRGAALANFVIGPTVIVSIVAFVAYALRSTPLREQLLASYIFSARKSTQPEKGEPDLIADARLFAVALFVFGIGLEGGACAIAVLIGAPRASSSSIGIDYALIVASCIVILVVLGFLVKIVQTTKENFECVPAEIRRKKNPKKTPASAVLAISRILYGYNGWTLIDSDDAAAPGVVDAKRFFLRYRVVFLKNVGPSASTYAGNDDDDYSSPSVPPSKFRTAIHNVAMYTVLVSFLCTIATGIVRGLIIAGVFNCRSAAIFLLIIQIIYFCWTIIIQSALAPITRLFNVVMTFLLFYAAISLFYDSSAAATIAITGAAILSIIGLGIAAGKVLMRKCFGLIMFPTRDARFVDGDDNDNKDAVNNFSGNDIILGARGEVANNNNSSYSNSYNTRIVHSSNSGNRVNTALITVPRNYNEMLVDSEIEDDSYMQGLNDYLLGPEQEMQTMSPKNNNNNNNNNKSKKQSDAENKLQGITL